MDAAVEEEVSLMRVRLVPGAKVDEVIRLLEQFAVNAYSVGAMQPEMYHKQIEYVRWASTTERTLHGVLSRDEAERLFDHPRHHLICSMTPNNQIATLIADELEARTLDFRELAGELKRQLTRMTAAPGYPIVLDTNVLLQCQRPDYLAWNSEVKELARVILPLRVLEEIDSKKYGTNPRLSKTARSLLSWIDSLFEGGNSGPIELRPREATIELLLADRPRHRPEDPDEELLDVCHDVLHFAGRVKVMTGDTGMRVRATSEGLDVLVIPAAWQRQEAPDSYTASDSDARR